MRNASTCATLLVALQCAVVTAQAAEQSHRFSVLNLDEQKQTCRVKGRFQDKEYCDSRFIDQIVAAGKEAIPALISQLTDNRRTSEPVWDFWQYTTAGDVAFFILTDLFTDSDWKTRTAPGLKAFELRCRQTEAAETCWRRFLQTHPRTLIQRQWLAEWRANEERIYWDEKARCFRMKPVRNH